MSDYMFLISFYSRTSNSTEYENSHNVLKYMKYFYDIYEINKILFYRCDENKKMYAYSIFKLDYFLLLRS